MNTPFPCDFWRRFSNPELEDRYRAEMHGQSSVLARRVCAIGVLMGVAKMTSLCREGRITVVRDLPLVISAILAGTVLWCALKKKGPFAPNNIQGRLNLLSFLRIVVAIINATHFLLTSRFQIDASDGGQAFILLCTRTPIVPLVFCLASQFPFKTHVWVQAVATLASLPWVTRLQGECGANPVLANSLNVMSHIIEGVLVRISVLGIPIKRPPLSSNQYPCWLGAIFLHVFFGFVLPTLILYILESRSRFEFLKSVNGDNQNDDLNVCFWSGIIFMALAAIVGTQIIWFALKGIDKLHSQHICHAKF